MIELSAFQSLLEYLRSTSSRTKKIQILKNEIGSADTKLAKLWVWMLDPYRTFGIKIIPKASNSTCEYKPDWDGFNRLLEDLEFRRLTGNDAKQAVAGFLGQLPIEEQRAVHAILKKRPDCGVSVSAFNAAFDIIPVFKIAKAIEWNADKVKALLSKYGYVIVQPKYDGFRRVSISSVGTTEFYTSNGNVDSNFPELVELIHELLPKNYVFDGELWPHDDDFNRLTSMCNSNDTFSLQEANLCFCVFDVLTMREWTELGPTPSQKERTRNLERIFRQQKQLEGNPWIYRVPSIHCKTFEDVETAFEHYLEQGFEGIIVKNPFVPYSFTRNDHWIKQKIEETVDLQILNILPGDEGKAFESSLGRFLCEYNGVEVKVAPGKMAHTIRQQVWDRREEYIGRTIEVAYQKVTKDGSLRHPRFVRFRIDKD